MPTHFCGCAGQFRQTLNNISKSIYIVNICSLYLILPSLYFFAGCCLNSYFFQIECVSRCLSSHCKQNCVELFYRFNLVSLLIFYNDLKFTILFLFNTLRQWSLNYINFPQPQILQQVFYHISIKSAQIVSSSHQTNIISHSF